MDSNHRPAVYKTAALPAELQGRALKTFRTAHAVLADSGSASGSKGVLDRVYSRAKFCNGTVFDAATLERYPERALRQGVLESLKLCGSVGHSKTKIRAHL